MKAIAISSDEKALQTIDRPEPSISSPYDIKLRILEVGICGTDREEVAGERGTPPEGKEYLVIGHEMFGQVVEVGAKVIRVKPGDYAVFTVRRGCGKCLPCAMNRSDMCRTGGYKERGIKSMDGYETEYVVDKEQYVIRVPAELRSVGVLVEPLSIGEKAITEAVNIQQTRLPDAPAAPDWLNGRKCLVAGLGPVGLLAAMALRLRGSEVYGLDIVDSKSARPEWLAAIGGHYIDGRDVRPDKVDEKVGKMDLIFEAAGIAALEFNLLDALATNGVYVLTGIPGGNRPLQVPGDQLIRNLVLQNQVMLGSVNASQGHFQMAVDDLMKARLLWGERVDRLITNRFHYTDFPDALLKHHADEIKVVLQWAS
ncbi:MAG TPA: glucose 1-dehydrogenase [Dissulfurispiraceae bacterium]